VSRSSDGRFVNTAIVERAQGVQTDLPVDTGGLPEPRTAPPPASPAGGLFDEAPAAAPVPAGGIFDDDDIPF
jgi:hypothetical protein